MDSLYNKFLLQLKQAGSASLFEILAGSVLVLITIVAIYRKTYNDGQAPPTCDNYVLNTFLYVILGLLLIILLCMINDKVPILPDITKMLLKTNGNIWMILLILLVIFGLLLLFIYMTKNGDPRNVLLIHAYWGSFIYILAVLLYLLYLISRLFGVFYIGMGITAILVVIVSYIGYTYADLIDPSYRLWLIGALIAIIVIGVVAVLFVRDPIILSAIMLGITIASFVIFVLFLLIEVSIVRQNAKTCIIPNYPAESLLIIYDIFIIFKDILRLLIYGRNSKFRSIKLKLKR
jgi:FtsH-binding integral membrane protein